MNKLSESAKLYFKDYVILSNLQNEIHKFLDEILYDFDKKINARYQSNDEYEKINWLNESSKGYSEIYLYRIIGIKNKEKIKLPKIIYRDCRLLQIGDEKYGTNADNRSANIISLSVESAKDKIAKETKKNLLKIDKTIFDEYEVAVNTNNSADTVATLLDKTEIIVNKFRKAVKEIDL